MKNLMHDRIYTDVHVNRVVVVQKLVVYVDSCVRIKLCI